MTVSITKNGLVEEYGDYVNRLVFRMIHDKKLAADASQEVWLEILNNLASFRDESDLTTWIYTIASRVVLKISHKEKKFSHDGIDEFFAEKKEFALEPSVEKEMWVRDTCDRCVTAFLRCLRHDDRMALLLKDLLELEYSQIADIMNVSEPALRKQVSRSREKIRNYLNNECAILNPDGSCRCHIREHVEEVNLSDTYTKLRAAQTSCTELELLEKCLPTKNYWKKFI